MSGREAGVWGEVMEGGLVGAGRSAQPASCSTSSPVSPAGPAVRSCTPGGVAGETARTSLTPGLPPRGLVVRGGQDRPWLVNRNTSLNSNGHEAGTWRPFEGGRSFFTRRTSEIADRRARAQITARQLAAVPSLALTAFESRG